MQYRTLGQSSYRVSTVSLGTWAFGGDFGPISDEQSLATLTRAYEEGVNFFDTADVYGDGRSERVVAKLRKKVDRGIYIATKAGRRLSPHAADGYNYENLRAFVERSLENLEVEALDLLQLHCPPPEAYYRKEPFEALDELKREGKIVHYGVSVEKVEEGLKALDFPGVTSIQIIYNMFRQRPAELLFEQAAKHQVGILARVPLASGLLSGKMDPYRQFSEKDHRNYNRRGQAFDQGETFSGVDFARGIELANELKRALPEGVTLAQAALRWILMNPHVTCAIPGAKSPEQAADNARAAELPDLDDALMRKVAELYEEQVKPSVHHRW